MPLTMTTAGGNYGALFTPKIIAKGDIKFIPGKISFDNSYPSDGEAMDLSDHLKSVEGVMFESKAGYVFEYDYTNKKVKVYYADYDAVADGALIEVPNETDLAALEDVRFLAWGY